MDVKGKSDQPKRRACDECRGRKLACSKESDGCSRCKREGIKCVYSPQKRMGRPRKHRTVDTVEPAPPPPPPAIEPKEEPIKELVPVVFPDFEFDSTIGMDLDLSFLDMNNLDVNFLDIVDPNSEFLPAPAENATDQTPSAYPQTQQKKPGHGAFWPMNDHLGDINFDAPPQPTALPKASEFTAEEIAQMFSVDVAETLPSLSPPSSSSPSTYAATPEQDNSAPSCGCLSALYLALDSLQTLPNKVGDAMRVARTATKTAHDTILCPVCGDPPINPNCAPPMASLQSMMMLGALLPSVSNAYMRILEMVDAEAAAADAERRNLVFTLSAYGGLWGWMASPSANAKCGGAGRLEEAVLEPVLWRLTVRALLKLDVYGVHEMRADFASDDVQQPGLKEIITMMEERSRRRHSQMDALVASGAIQKPPGDYVPLSEAGDKPTCMRIIDIAKRSMDELVIP